MNLTRAPTPGSIVVLGVGNIQWADAGFGVRAVERFRAQWQCAPHVEIVEAGIRGLSLLPLLEAARRLIVFNAVDLGHAPGTLHVHTGDDASGRLRTRGASLHQMDCVDVLAYAQLKGRAPREIVLISAQPLDLDTYGADLSPAVSAQLDPAIALACRWLRRWRAAPQPRAHPPGGVRLPGSGPELDI